MHGNHLFIPVKELVKQRQMILALKGKGEDGVMIGKQRGLGKGCPNSCT